MAGRKPIIHARDHEHGGADPVHIVYEDVGVVLLGIEDEGAGVASVSGGTVIMDEATALPTRSALNFVGAGVTATDDAANDRVNVTIPGGGAGTVNPAFSATIVSYAKFTDASFPAYTWYCPNWAATGSGNTQLKNTLGVTFGHLQGTNDVLVMPTGGTGYWYRLHASHYFLLPNTDATALADHWLYAVGCQVVGGTVTATAQTRPLIAMTAGQHNSFSTAGGTTYKRVWVVSDSTFVLGGNLATGNAGLSLSLRSIVPTLDALINNATNLQCEVFLERLPLTYP